jgi:single-stranded DNA-binding protein
MMRYLMKVPALNVTHVCGTVTALPTVLPSSDRPAGAIFELSAQTYERGRKTNPVRLKVVCWASLAEAALSQLREGDVVLVTGSLHNHHASRGPLGLVASVVQFLTTGTETPSQSE